MNIFRTGLFRNDTFQAYEDFVCVCVCERIEVKTPKEIHLERIWHKKKFKIRSKVFDRNDRTEKNVYIVKGLVNDNGQSLNIKNRNSTLRGFVVVVCLFKYLGFH